MVEKLLTIGCKIEIRPYIGKIEYTPLYERIYMSQLMDIKEGGRVSITMPTEGGRMVVLDVGERYELIFYTKSGLYSCVARVEARGRMGALVLAELFFLSPLEKYQRRQYYRLDCILDVSYWKAEMPDVIKSGTVIDISGGGLRFKCDEGYETDTMLSMRINLPSLKMNQGKEIQAKVISSEALPSMEGMYENRVEFLDVANNVREAIVKFIFEEERKRRRRDNGG